MSHHDKHAHGQLQSHPAQQESPQVLAYRLWEKAGCPQGQAARFWLEAEEQIKRLHLSSVPCVH